MLEFALIMPVLVMVMLAVFDAGLYVTAYISVREAARAAATRNSGGRESAVDQAQACAIVLDQLRGLPGVPADTACTSAPVVVSSELCLGPSPCGGQPTTADGQPAALVTVRYTVPHLFRFPIAGPPTVTQSAQMKLRSYE
jgi:Flp pilus assembly protein TadG